MSYNYDINSKLSSTQGPLHLDYNQSRFLL